MRILSFFALASMSSALVGAGLAGAPGTGRASVAAQPMAPSNYLAGSTKEVCPLTGHGETQTAVRFGLEAADHGYSFRYQGKLWFLFGDAQPTPTFPLSSDVSNENRWSDDPSSLLNDAIAYASPSVPGSCPVLQFIPQTTTAVGAYTDPTVTYDGHLLSLRTSESPVAGIGLTVNSQSRMYVVFNTNNPKATSTPKTCAGRPAGCLGYPYTSVMAVLDDPAKLSFRALYTFSGPPPGPPPYSAPGKFVNVAMALAPDGYVYFWGTIGASEPCAPGLSQCYRHSYVYLARIRATEIAHASASGRPAAIEYFERTRFVPGSSESAATPLFRDDPPCMGELGVEWNPIFREWMMLYKCLTASPRGIVMRLAPAPWGPWSGPQTIFNPLTDHGYCYFIHLQVTRHETCPAGTPNPGAGTSGGDYGPYFISGWTTGRYQTRTAPAYSTFYYTVDTFDPYGEVIMKSTIEGPRPQQPHPTATTRPTPCGTHCL